MKTVSHIHTAICRSQAHRWFGLAALLLAVPGCKTMGDCSSDGLETDCLELKDTGTADTALERLHGARKDTRRGPRAHGAIDLPGGPDDGDFTETPTSEFDLVYSDPSRTTHWVRSRRTSFGFTDLGGGVMSCILPNQTEGLPDRCDSLPRDANLVAPDFGKSWQATMRDSQHRGRHNPTQAGYDDSYGVPVDVSMGESCDGEGGRMYIAPFRMAIFSNSKYDWVQNEDIATDGYKEDDDNTDNDGVDETGLSQLDEVESEFNFTGYYEDASDRVTADVAVLRHMFQADFRRDPDAIFQFGEGGVMDNGVSALNPSAVPRDLAPDAGGHELLQGPQVATPEDYATTNLSYSGRVRYSFRHNNVLWVDARGEWQEDEVVECEKKVLVQYGEDRFHELYDKNPDGKMGGDPDDFAGQTETPLMILSSGGIDEVDTADAVALYLPENTCNQQHVVGWDPDTGETVYTQDRRTRVLFSANRRACRTGTDKDERLIWEDPEGIRPSRYAENDQTNIAIRLYQLGLLNPSATPEGLIERMRMDVRLLVGTPSEILKAVTELQAMSEIDPESCEVTPTCER
jgi:hypothetical protein